MINYLKLNKKTLIFIAKLLFAMGLLIWIGAKQDWENLKSALLDVNPLILMVGALGFIFSQVFVAVRWNILLRVQGIKIKFSSLIKLHFLGLFYNNFLPSSVGGDFLRAWYVAKHTERRVEAVISVFFDRVIGLFSLILMGAFGYGLLILSEDWDFLALNQSQNQTQENQFYSLLVWGAVILVVIIGFFTGLLAFLPILRQRFLNFIIFCKSRVLRVLESIKIYIKHPFLLILSILITAVGQTVCIAGFWLIGDNIGVNAPAKYYFIFFPIIWVVGVIPVSIGGIGILEGLLTILFAHIGGNQEAAFALALFQRFILLIGSLPGIFFHLTGGHLPGQEFFVDSKDKLY